jgi:hypothetical protein
MPMQYSFLKAVRSAVNFNDPREVCQDYLYPMSCITEALEHVDEETKVNT